MIKFILNNTDISTNAPPGTLVLDYVRYEKHLKGTKIGCREGDCGACTVLVGQVKDDKLTYQSFTSCLTPLGNVHGKHVVTIEGINMKEQNVVQSAMTNCSATQCGFCTPGFVMSLAGFCLSHKEPTYNNAIASIDGNICRCTGYKSIERAAAEVIESLQHKKLDNPIEWGTKNNIFPIYFNSIETRLKNLALQLNGELDNTSPLPRFVGGGTDLYVQKHDEMKYADINFTFDKSALKGIAVEGDKCIIGASATVTDLSELEVFKKYFPHFKKQVKLISSTPIRNMATIAGNLVNASPIGDFTIFFLALDAVLVLNDGSKKREVPLRNFYKGYKLLNRNDNEHIEKIYFNLPASNALFNFEKVSKRTHLDIASVNSAIAIKVTDGFITNASISAGGVGPVPTFLHKASSFLAGKLLNEDLVKAAIEVAQTEISPISDARGTSAYKRLLLGQLIKAHFITLFPELKVKMLLAVKDKA